MIRSFADSDTKELFGDRFVRRFQAIERIARRKLIQLDQTATVRASTASVSQYTIRINDQYRVCFVWPEGDAFQVEIVDYH